MPENPVIAIIMATLLEAEPLIEALALQKDEDRPCPTFMSEDIVILISGMGKANAAMATTCACLRFMPKLICNLGAAGALKETLPLGSIHQIGKVIEPDRPELLNSKLHVFIPRTLPDFPNAVLATHDRPIKTLEERRATAIHADLCDMEGAAVAQTAENFGVPCLLFKFVSDTPHPGEQKNIVNRIKDLRTPFCHFFLDSVRKKLQPGNRGKNSGVI